MSLHKGTTTKTEFQAQLISLLKLEAIVNDARAPGLSFDFTFGVGSGCWIKKDQAKCLQQLQEQQDQLLREISAQDGDDKGSVMTAMSNSLTNRSKQTHPFGTPLVF